LLGPLYGIKNLAKLNADLRLSSLLYYSPSNSPPRRNAREEKQHGFPAGCAAVFALPYPAAVLCQSNQYNEGNPASLEQSLPAFDF